MIAATPWAATSCGSRQPVIVTEAPKMILTFTPCTYGGEEREGTNAPGDACGERFPNADAARGPASAVRGSTKSSRRLFGEGGCHGSRMGRPEGRPG